MDLREYLEQLTSTRELYRIRAEIDPDLELAALCRREFVNERGTALLFERLAGFRFQAAANLFGSAARMAKIVRSEKLSHFTAKLQRLLQARQGSSSERLLSFAEPASSPPARHKPQWHCRPDATLFALPAIRSWPLEERPYLTLPLVVSRHPQTGAQNLGLYRAQVVSETQAAINFPPGSGAGEHLTAAAELGEPLPVALVFGGDPALCWLAAAPLPAGCDDYGLFRNLFGEEQQLSLGITQDLLIPSNAEFVVEGIINPGQTCSEGPFGNHTGSYVSRKDCPVLEITSIAWRDQAVMPFTVVGPPPSENVYLGRVNEMLVREMLRIDFPDILALRMPELTLFHGAALLQVAPGGKTAALELIQNLWGNSPLQNSRLLVLCDADLDLSHSELVYWRLVNLLDSSRLHWRGKQLAIDATGIDPARLVVEDKSTAELLQRRRRE